MTEPQKRVLIMEDNVGLALNWKLAFELNACEVVLSHSGDEAIDFLEAEKFDLVITDMFVPNKNGGLHVLMKLFTMGRDAPPAIAVTGEIHSMGDNYTTNVFLDQASRLGAAKHLQKPFPAGELVLMAHSFWEL